MTRKDKTKINQIDERISKRFKLCRLMVGASQQQLADVIGVSVQQIQKYETGVNNVSSNNLYNLAKHLKVPINYFYDESEDNIINMIAEEAATYDSSNNLNKIYNGNMKELTVLVKEFNKIESPKVRGTIIELVRSIACTA